MALLAWHFIIGCSLWCVWREPKTNRGLALGSRSKGCVAMIVALCTSKLLIPLHNITRACWIRSNTPLVQCPVLTVAKQVPMERSGAGSGHNSPLPTCDSWYSAKVNYGLKGHGNQARTKQLPIFLAAYSKVGLICIRWQKLASWLVWCQSSELLVYFYHANLSFSVLLCYSDSTGWKSGEQCCPTTQYATANNRSKTSSR